MRANTIFIPGRFEEAFVYRHWLVALTDERSLRFYRLSRIIDFVNHSISDCQMTSSMLFLHSEWMSSELFKTIISDHNMLEVFVRRMDQFPSPYFGMHDEWRPDTEINLKINDDFFTSLLIYNMRMYVSTDESLYHLNIDWRNDLPSVIGIPNRRLDTKCYSVTAKYGAITASCGSEGLFTSIEDFYNFGSNGQRMQRKKGSSIRAEWLSHNLVNYSTRRDLTLLLNSYQKKKSRTEGYRDDTIVTDIGVSEHELNYLLNDNGRRVRIEGDISYVYNTSNALVVQTDIGNIYLIGMTHTNDPRPSQDYIRKYAKLNVRVIDAAYSPFGLLLETDDSVILFRDGRLYTVFDSEVISARTFGAARRLRNVMTVVEEEGIRLIGLFDESALLESSPLNRRGKSRLRELPTTYRAGRRDPVSGVTRSP